MHGFLFVRCFLFFCSSLNHTYLGTFQSCGSLQTGPYSNYKRTERYFSWPTHRVTVTGWDWNTAVHTTPVQDPAGKTPISKVGKCQPWLLPATAQCLNLIMCLVASTSFKGRFTFMCMYIPWVFTTNSDFFDVAELSKHFILWIYFRNYIGIQEDFTFFIICLHPLLNIRTVILNLSERQVQFRALKQVLEYFTIGFAS